MALPLLPPSKSTVVGKKISTDALLGKNKKSGAIVKTGKSSIQLKPKISSSIVKISDIKNQQDEKVVDDFGDIRKRFFNIGNTLDSITKFFISRKNEKIKDAKEDTKQDEKEKKSKRERELEEKKPPSIENLKRPKIPGLNFFDSIINFFGSILLGSLLNFLLSKKDFIFKAFDDILKGFDNIFNVMKFSIISISNTAGNLVKSVGQVTARLFKGPAKFTLNLLKKLGGSVKNLLFKAGKAIGNFVKGTFKNVSSLATGAGATRATGVSKRVDPTKGKLRTKPVKPGTPRPTNTSILKRSEKLFGEKGAKHLGKVSKVFKKIPFIGALIGIGIDLAMGERLDNAVAGAAGATLGAAIGGAIGTVALPIPGVGSFLGGIIGAAIGDWAGKEIYKNMTGQITQINPKPEDLGEPTSTPDPGSTGGGGGGGRMLPGNAPAEVNAALEAIAGAEGGWDSMNPGKVVSGLRNMTIAQARETGMRQRATSGSGALGKFQQIPVYDGVNVLKQRAEAAGLNYERDKFNEENQTKIARAYLASIYPGGESQMIKDARKDPMILASKLKGVYPSLPGGSQQNVHTSGYLSRYRNALQKYQGVTVGPSQNQGITYQTNTYRNQYYGAPRPGRKHAGVDLQMYSGSKQITFLGGRVIHIGNEPGGYYQYVDILTPTGKIERLAELGRLDGAVKKGAVLAPGQVVSYGVGPTGVTHLEYRTPGTSGFSGTVNPLEYLKSVGAIFGGNTFQYKGGMGGAVPTGPSVARVPQQPTQSLSQQATQLARQTTYEGQQQIVPIPIPVGDQSSPMIIGGGGGGGILPIGLSKKDALNSYYRAQLMGFLYKQG